MSTRHTVKRAVIINPGRDDGRHHTVETEYLGKSATVDLLSPYGLYSTPLANSLMTVFNVCGYEENKVGIAHDPDVRFRNLGPGEVAIGNPGAKNLVYFQNNGDIRIKTPKDLVINVTADGNIKIEGNANIEVLGNTTVKSTGDVNVNTDGQINLGKSTSGSGTMLPVKLSDDTPSSNVYARKS